MLLELTPLEKILLPNLTIHAPTVRQALQMWLASVKSMPDGKNFRMKWKFLDERLAQAGPVFYQDPRRERDDEEDLKPSIPAIDILVKMLEPFGGVLKGNQDGSWEIARRNKGASQRRYLGEHIAQFEVPPEVFGPLPAPPPKDEWESAPLDWSSTKRIHHLALYSATTHILIVKGTALDHLRVIKTLNEKWPKPEPRKDKRKQKNTKR